MMLGKAQLGFFSIKAPQLLTGFDEHIFHEINFSSIHSGIDFAKENQPLGAKA
jgi:hypothetical protein